MKTVIGFYYAVMLSEKEKTEFAEKLNKLKKGQEEFRSNRKESKPDDENHERYKPIGAVYEFISMSFAVSLAGYFIGKYTNTLPWTMVAFILIGFSYAFYRLFKSVSKNS